jgi:hypothetical protein
MSVPVSHGRAGHIGGDDSAAGSRALHLLWWIPASPVVGFLAAEALLSSSWPLWQVLPLAVVLATPFAIGAVEAGRAVRLGDRRGWPLLAVHAAFAALALALPISESLAT